jgi:hypothetical protein
LKSRPRWARGETSDGIAVPVHAFPVRVPRRLAACSAAACHCCACDIHVCPSWTVCDRRARNTHGVSHTGPETFRLQHPNILLATWNHCLIVLDVDYIPVLEFYWPEKRVRRTEDAKLKRQCVIPFPSWTARIMTGKGCEQRGCGSLMHDSGRVHNSPKQPTAILLLTRSSLLRVVRYFHGNRRPSRPTAAYDVSGRSAA